MRCGYTPLRLYRSSMTNWVYHDVRGHTTPEMSPWTRMSSTNIRPVLDSRAIPRVTLGSPLLTHHHHSRPLWRRPHPVPLLISRTRCSLSLTALMPFRTRQRSTESLLPWTWRPFEMTCVPSLPTKTLFSRISSPSRPSSPSYSPSTSHCRHHRSDTTAHQGCFLHPLLFFFSKWAHWTHLFGGVWAVIGFLLD